MTEEAANKDQPVIVEDTPFVVKVKLLSNEVFEIKTNADVSMEQSRF